MNKSESDKILHCLEISGYRNVSAFKEADLFVVNTCVVRQNAEEKVMGLLAQLKGIKNGRKDMKIVVTGCFVDSDEKQLYNKYPHVDLFFKPGNFDDFFKWFETNKYSGLINALPEYENKTGEMFSLIPIIQGCDNFCSYCIVPYRRGREKSRAKEGIIKEIIELSEAGAKEITLLGQNVNSYGKDLYETYRLIDLLAEVNGIKGLMRIRFLTNHPKDMDERLIKELPNLNRVCKHLNIPVQSGNNDILKAMNRGYSREYYLELIDTIKKWIPGVSLSTDIIVGFPGETDEQFMDTVDLISRVKFDVVHAAMYSPRTGTLALKRFKDDVSMDEKKQRFNRIEMIQEEISRDINDKLINTEINILVEGQKNNKWFGRTESNKLVFLEQKRCKTGEKIKVKISRSTAWSLRGEITQ